MSEYICQCGCGQPIPPRPHHRYRPPKYILCHFLEMKNTSRIENLRKAKAANRPKPPEGWVPPSGICECGCGQPTTIAKVRKKERDEYPGYPHRYISGHNLLGHGKGPDNSRWKGGRWTNNQGYVFVYMPDHPQSDKDGYVLEHRLVYEQTHGVTLESTDIIHHINSVRDDNRPENLVKTTRSRHSRDHDALGAYRSEHPEEAAQKRIEAGKLGAKHRWG